MKIEIKKITKDNFSQYGELITINNEEAKSGNANTAEFFFDLAKIEVLGNDTSARFNIIKTIKRNFPLRIEMMEMHPYSSQVFLPYSKTKFIVMVAPGNIRPDLNKIECFLVSNGDGINFNAKIWHCPLTSTEVETFIMIDKKDFKTNIAIYDFKEEEIFNLDYE
jgi:ureidoglycolate lyase